MVSVREGMKELGKQVLE
jgi:hypothetical protein